MVLDSVRTWQCLQLAQEWFRDPRVPGRHLLDPACGKVLRVDTGYGTDAVSPSITTHLIDHAAYL
jgi:hypothetical protein